MWRQRIAACESSGLSVQDYCAREGFSTASFYKWRQRLLGANRQQTPRLEFVQVAGAQDNALELVISADLVVRVRAGFDPAALSQLLDVLRRR